MFEYKLWKQEEESPYQTENTEWMSASYFILAEGQNVFFLLLVFSVCTYQMF